MSIVFLSRFFVGVTALLCVCCIELYAQPGKGSPAQDVAAKPRKVSSEPKEAHKRWLTRDVPYIITEAEKKAFLALKTDDERENFISIFWRNRDPNPDTEENEFREEYYERIAYANEHFSSGIPGWRTDRGRIYITWGNPDSVESRPSGGSYDRPAYEGGGTITAYSFEVWFYRHLDGVGDGIEIEFVDPTGTGEYRIARDIDEKNALATTQGKNLSREDGGFVLRQQDTPLGRAALIKDLQTPPRIRFTDLEPLAKADSGIVDNNPLDFDLRIDYFRQSEDRVIAAFTIQANNSELSFKQVGGLNTATLNIFGQVTAVSNRRTGIFEDSVTTNASSDELSKLREKRSVYQRSLALSPGVYKIDVVVRDTVTGNRGLVSQGFTVPRYPDGKLSTSSLILATTLRASTASDIGRMFVIGKEKVIPNLSGEFRQGDEVGVYLQLYNAGVDQTTLRPAVDVDYILVRDGTELFRTKEDWSGLSDSGQRLTLARMIPTGRMPIGEYELLVSIRDKVNGQVIENKGKFTITQ